MTNKPESTIFYDKETDQHIVDMGDGSIQAKSGNVKTTMNADGTMSLDAHITTVNLFDISRVSKYEITSDADFDLHVMTFKDGKVATIKLSRVDGKLAAMEANCQIMLPKEGLVLNIKDAEAETPA